MDKAFAFVDGKDLDMKGLNEAIHHIFERLTELETKPKATKKSSKKK
jgi:hypothetical protein